MDDTNRKLLAANVVGLVVNLGLAALLAVNLLGEDEALPAGGTIATMGGAPSDGAPPPPGADAAPPSGGGPPPPPPPDGPERTARFLDDTITPLKKAAADMGGDLTTLLPSDADLAAAKATGSLSSPESQAVIATLEAAYGQFNMPFPEVPVAGAAPGGGAAPRPDAPQATTTDGGEQDILRAYFTVTVSQVKAQADAKGVDISGALPDDAAVQAAIATGDIGSEASEAVLDALRAAHEQAGIPFREPAVQ